MAGFEPASKQGTNMLSTRLSWPSIFEQWQDPSHQPLPYLLNLIFASQPTKTSPDISAPLDPFSLWALAWSDVSVQHLVPKLGESTILRLRSESYSIVASYNGEPYLRAVFMLDVLTYLFYLLSKPNIPIVAQIAGAKVQHFFGLYKYLRDFFSFQLLVFSFQLAVFRCMLLQYASPNGDAQYLSD